ncbi:hypothetical protein ACJ3_31480 [Pantoea sp. QMID3]|nr:hypothetical protein ACJ3_31480 [Pantoea sp. QMID3]
MLPGTAKAAAGRRAETLRSQTKEKVCNPPERDPHTSVKVFINQLIKLRTSEYGNNRSERGIWLQLRHRGFAREALNYPAKLGC